MSSITTDLAAALSTVRRPGDFFVSGTTELLAPLLEVDDVGPIALPLLPMQARQLVAVAERAPYGRGEETLVDTAVRRTWQIGANRVRIQGKHWARTLDAILARASDGLGMSEPVTAELYKLLVYDQGSFFVRHRDTEKAPGMFATLVIVLPSISAGGDLVVRHKSREARLELRCHEPSEVAFAAFYADCIHEVLPVTEGCRLTLVYNLLRRGRGPLPEPPSYEGEQGRVAALLRAWGKGGKSPGDDIPEKLIYPLEHAYTPAELGFAALKGADAAMAAVLAAAARKSDTELHLALLTVEESGIADYTGYDSRRGRWSEPEVELEAGEVEDCSVSLSEWRRLDGSPSMLLELPVEDDELSPPDALEDMDPDEEHFHEATGNEGASFERTYRRAALVLWPREGFFAVLNQAGLPVTLPYLADLTERWTASGEDHRSHLWDQAHDLSGHMVSKWPTHPWYPRHDNSPSEAPRMLTLLTRLDDAPRIEALLDKIVACSGYDKQDNDAMIGALAILSPAKRAARLEQIIAATAAMSLGACGELLGRAVAALAVQRQTSLVGAAAALIEALPGDPARPVVSDAWRRGPGVDPDFIVDLLTALEQIDEALAGGAADHILAWPKTYRIDAVLVPAIRKLAAMHNASAPVQKLRTVCLDHLRARIAQPLEAPKDWRRVSALACSCRRCAELGRFLADPERRMWTFKAAEAERSHVEGTVRQARCDLDLTTDKRGRPYTLVCTKNQASYDRRAKQRKQDLEDLARLDR